MSYEAELNRRSDGIKKVLTATFRREDGSLAPIYQTSALHFETNNPAVSNTEGKFFPVYLDPSRQYHVTLSDNQSTIDTWTENTHAP